jgi:hypothetical protein
MYIVSYLGMLIRLWIKTPLRPPPPPLRINLRIADIYNKINNNEITRLGGGGGQFVICAVYNKEKGKLIIFRALLFKF